MLISFIFDRYRDRDRRRSQLLWPSSTARTGAVCTTTTQATSAAVVAAAPPPERASPPSPLLGEGARGGGHGGGSLLEEATGRGTSSARGNRRGSASAARASDTSRKGGVGRSIMRADRLGWSSGGAWSSSPPLKRRRPGGPNRPTHKGTVRLQVFRGVVAGFPRCGCLVPVSQRPTLPHSCLTVLIA